MHQALAKVDKNEKKKVARGIEEVYIYSKEYVYSLFFSPVYIQIHAPTDILHFSSFSWLHRIVITHSLAHRMIGSAHRFFSSIVNKSPLRL